MQPQIHWETELLTELWVGAGIQIPPNSGRLLRRWGVMKHLDEWAAKPECINFRRWQNGNVIGHTDLGKAFIADYTEPYYVAHRAHFHEALVQTAVELGVDLRLDCKVKEYYEAQGCVVLESGIRIQGDLVVAADGQYNLTGTAPLLTQSRYQVDRSRRLASEHCPRTGE